jgi:hypothetical protein
LKKVLLALLSIFGLFSFSQEMEDDLFATLSSSSLHIFKNSEKTKMTIRTYRNSPKNGIVEETTSNYRKGKINPLRINFNIHYTEYYILEDRKKSLGKFEFNENNEIYRYERTDFDNRNQRSVTFYHFYYYTDAIVSREDIRTKEYVGQGSAELDTIVYKDSVLYKITGENNDYNQENLTDPGVNISYSLEDGKLKNKTDSKGHLVKIGNTLTTDEGKEVTTRTEIHYSIDGLITESIFYNENNELLERKVFTYK